VTRVRVAGVRGSAPGGGWGRAGGAGAGGPSTPPCRSHTDPEGGEDMVATPPLLHGSHSPSLPHSSRPAPSRPPADVSPPVLTWRPGCWCSARAPRDMERASAGRSVERHRASATRRSRRAWAALCSACTGCTVCGALLARPISVGLGSGGSLQGSAPSPQPFLVTLGWV